ncbi:hypothetical protein PM082_011097 [Marasmius tenuissimus]|nr:hypothetical protein PM082_011097 [Marasmius tenuissimus]
MLRSASSHCIQSETSRARHRDGRGGDVRMQGRKELETQKSEDLSWTSREIEVDTVIKRVGSLNAAKDEILLGRIIDWYRLLWVNTRPAHAYILP